jgi:hypothetical protein
LSQKGFGKRRELSGGCQIVLVTSGIFLEKKTRNVPELPETCGSFSLAKITGLEMFWNASKIILVGTRNVLRPTEIFSDLTIAEKCFHE